MGKFTVLIRSLFLCLFLGGVSSSLAEDRFARIAVNGKVYENVFVGEVHESSIIIKHSKGIAQIDLRDLSDDLKRYFNYDAAKDESRRKALATQAIARSKSTAEKVKDESDVDTSSRLMKLFGTAPTVKRNVDYRPTYSKLELGTRNQGSRPSCSVFAMISAIEYLQAAKTGRSEKLSEEYLIWAVLKTLGKSSEGIGEEAEVGVDAGFTLFEVAQALRAFGIPLRSQMPYSLFGDIGSERSPSPEIIEDARTRSKIAAYMIPGRTNEVIVANIVHALNSDTPIVIGIAWPHYNKLANTALLSKQTPLQGAGHAVTLVGYRSDTGRIQDASFIFRNSWGRDWGSGGYGIIRYEYLVKHMNSALLLEL